jgi:GntR family transcriptional repressor for pyruvate dehydrogenase complex
MDKNEKPTKTAMLVAQRLVRDIDRMGLQPGDTLPPQRLMMEDYQVGRGTLRESLRFLEFQGVLSFKPGPGGGPVVEKPDAANLATALAILLQFDHAPYRVVAEARVAFEPLMAQLAAERITPAQLVELQDSITEMDDHLADTERYLQSNNKFHYVIAWASGNSLFGYLVDAMLGVLDINGTKHGIEYPLQRRAAVLKAHMQIYEALKAGDVHESEEAMRAHINEYATYAKRKFAASYNRRVMWE